MFKMAHQEYYVTRYNEQWHSSEIKFLTRKFYINNDLKKITIIHIQLER